MQMVRILDWEEEFRGKTLNSIRPKYIGEDFKPFVSLIFAGDFNYEVHPVKEAYFDGCFVNILRKSKPVEFVNVDSTSHSLIIEVWSKDFCLFELQGSFRRAPIDGPPLELFRLDQISND